jgi:uncharacterized UBP type Zn finger protein
MFKRLVAKGHAEFSGGKQQDALEFWHYFVDHVKQKEHVNRVDPADIFNFQQQVSHTHTYPSHRLYAHRCLRSTATKSSSLRRSS